MKKKTRNLLYGFLILLVGFVSWWDGITPLTPIKKVGPMRLPEDNVEDTLKWPERMWVKGRITFSGTTQFVVNDSTGTIVVNTYNRHPVGLNVVVGGQVTPFSHHPNYRDGYVYPSLYDVEIHVVLFFQTEAQITFFVGLLLISSLIGLAVWSIPKLQETRIKKDNKLIFGKYKKLTDYKPQLKSEMRQFANGKKKTRKLDAESIEPPKIVDKYCLYCKNEGWNGIPANKTCVKCGIRVCDNHLSNLEEKICSSCATKMK